MGGRVATFRKGNYVADLGAMVVTGLGEFYRIRKNWGGEKVHIHHIKQIGGFTPFPFLAKVIVCV